MKIKFDENATEFYVSQTGEPDKVMNSVLVQGTKARINFIIGIKGYIRLSSLLELLGINNDNYTIDHKLTGDEAITFTEQEDGSYIIDIDISDQPEIPRWIPVKERLPEEDGKYLVSFKYNPNVYTCFFAKDINEYCENNIGSYSGLIIKDGYYVKESISGFFDLDLSQDYPNSYTAFVDSGHIVAWMPLPEAYKEV